MSPDRPSCPPTRTAAASASPSSPGIPSLLTYPGGRRYPLNEDERARGAGYALLRRTAEAVALRVHLNETLAAAAVNGQPGTPTILCGDLNDGPDAITTVLLEGPADGDVNRPDKGDAVRLYDLGRCLPPPPSPRILPHLPRQRRAHRPHPGNPRPPTPAHAAVAALIAFHGLRTSQVQMLRLTDVRDRVLHVDDLAMPLAEPVQQALAAWLGHRRSRWPSTNNAYLFVTTRTANTDPPVSRTWICKATGPRLSTTDIRQDRILDEVQATNGDFDAWPTCSA